MQCTLARRVWWSLTSEVHIATLQRCRICYSAASKQLSQVQFWLKSLMVALRTVALGSNYKWMGNTVYNDRIGFSVSTVVLSKIPIYWYLGMQKKTAPYDSYGVLIVCWGDVWRCQQTLSASATLLLCKQAGVEKKKSSTNYQGTSAQLPPARLQNQYSYQFRIEVWNPVWWQHEKTAWLPVEGLNEGNWTHDLEDVSPHPKCLFSSKTKTKKILECSRYFSILF